MTGASSFSKNSYDMDSNLTFFTCVTAFVASVEVVVELDDADDAMLVLALPVCVVSVFIIVTISDSFIVILIIITIIVMVALA
jgi:hypothetical protein